jgi:hypothetical protein
MKRRDAVAVVVSLAIGLVGGAVAILVRRHQEQVEMATRPDAGIPLGTVVIDQSSVLLLQLRGPDFEEARGRGCPLEAFVEAQDAGYPVLRFRCTTYGAP